MVFVVNQILILFESIFCSNLRKNGRKVFLILTFAQMFVLLAFRSVSVGTDTETYIAMFRAVRLGVDIKQFEILNRVLMRVIVDLPYSEVLYLAIYAFLTLACFYYFIYRNSEDVYLSVAIFSGMMYYYLCFNIMRQALAISIVAVAITEFLNKKPYKAVIVIFVAAGFHTSALIALPLFAFSIVKIKYTSKMFIGTIISCGVMAVFGRNIVSLFLNLFTDYKNYIYSNLGDEGNYLNPLMYVIVLCLIMIIWKWGEGKKEDHFLLILMSIGTILYFASLQVEIVNRIVYYYTMSILIVLPNTIIRIRKSKERVLCLYGAHLAVALYSILLVARKAHGIVPYSFFWQ